MCVSDEEDSNDRLIDSDLMKEFVMEKCPLIEQLDVMELKSLAENILEEESSLKICNNCEGEIQDRDSMLFEICNGECNLGCLIDTENSMTC